MRSVDTSFYNSIAWRKTAQAYKREHPLCEICLKDGKVSPTEHIHHKVHLNRSNVTNPRIAYGFENLEAVCHSCHNKIHGRAEAEQKRYSVGPNGEIIC